MKPDSYMPFYGNEFFAATRGRPHYMRTAYLLCLWHNWEHNHCEGLDNDEEHLHGVSELHGIEWDKFYKIFFDTDGKFFTIGEDGKWHQKKQVEIWKASLEKYNKQVKRTQAATEARMKIKYKNKRND